MQAVKVNDRHLAVYGNTSLERAFCKQCQGFALVFDGKLACCGEPARGRAKIARQMVQAQQRRNGPSASFQRAQLLRQDGECLYCEMNLDGVVFRNGTPRMIQTHWDHIIPYSYSQNNKEINFVASCHVCNGIKSNKVFQDLEDARTYILRRRKDKGYE